MPPIDRRAETDASLAVLLVRVSVGLYFFFLAINKFTTGPTAWAEGNLAEYVNTWLPRILLVPFSYAMPFVDLALGAVLIVGYRTRLVLFAAGMLLILLSLGQVVLRDYDAATNYLFCLFITAFALSISRYNRFSIDGWRCKNGA